MWSCSASIVIFRPYFFRSKWRYRWRRCVYRCKFPHTRRPPWAVGWRGGRRLSKTSRPGCRLCRYGWFVSTAPFDIRDDFHNFASCPIHCQDFASSDATGDHAEDPSLKLETKLKTRVQRSKSFPHEESQIVELKLMPSFNEQEKEPAVEVCVSLHCLILLCRSFWPYVANLDLLQSVSRQMK